MSTSDECAPPSYQFKSVQQRTWPEERAHIKYELILRQQPKQSRMCGVGEKADRRPIDPPPIVQLIVRSPPSSSQDPSQHTSYLQNPYYFMHVSLIEKDSRAEVSLIRDDQDMDKDKSGPDMAERAREREKERERETSDSLLLKDSRTKATTGSCVSSLYPLKDFEDSGNESGFFVFPDLSVRMEGTYRLKFCLYEMTGSQVHFCASIVSAPLIVYSAKKFPGMEESTTLSQFFAEQGLKIRIRKEVRPKKRARVGYAREANFETPKQAKDHNNPSGSAEDDESRASDRAPKRIATLNDAQWSGADIPIRQAHPEHAKELPQRTEPATEGRPHPRPQIVPGSHPSNRNPGLIRSDPRDHRDPRNEHTRRSSDFSNRRNSDFDKPNPNPNPGVQDVTELTEIPEDEEGYRRSHPAGRYPREDPPDRGPEHPLDYLRPYDRLDPDYDPGYLPPSLNSRRQGHSQNDHPGGDRYARAPASYPADKRWPPPYMYPGYYYFYYPPPRRYPDPYLRRLDPRYPPYPHPRGPIPYPYFPPELLARGMVPYPYPPNFRSFHGEDAPYAPPLYPSASRRNSEGSDFYHGFPYPEPYPPHDQDMELQHYYPPDPYGPIRLPPSGNSSSSSSSQPPRRGYPHPPYPHGYPSYPPYNLPRGDHSDNEEMPESARPSTSTSDQQGYHRSAISKCHYQDPYHSMDSFEPLGIEPESVARPSPRSPSTPGRGGTHSDQRDIIHTSSFNLSLRSPAGQCQGPGSTAAVAGAAGPGPGPELDLFRRERVHVISEEGAQKPLESRLSKSVGDKGNSRVPREDDSVLADQSQGLVSLETVRSTSSHISQDRLGAALKYYGLPLHPRRDIRERYGNQNGGRGPYIPSTDNSEEERGSERGPEQGSMAIASAMDRMMEEQEEQSPPLLMPTGLHGVPPPYRTAYYNHHPFDPPYGAPYAPHTHRRNPGSMDSQNRMLTPSISYSYLPTALPASGATHSLRDRA